MLQAEEPPSGVDAARGAAAVSLPPPCRGGGGARHRRRRSARRRQQQSSRQLAPAGRCAAVRLRRRQARRAAWALAHALGPVACGAQALPAAQRGACTERRPPSPATGARRPLVPRGGCGPPVSPLLCLRGRPHPPGIPQNPEPARPMGCGALRRSPPRRRLLPLAPQRGRGAAHLGCCWAALLPACLRACLPACLPGGLDGWLACQPAQDMYKRRVAGWLPACFWTVFAAAHTVPSIAVAGLLCRGWCGEPCGGRTAASSSLVRGIRQHGQAGQRR